MVQEDLRTLSSADLVLFLHADEEIKEIPESKIKNGTTTSKERLWNESPG